MNDDDTRREGLRNSQSGRGQWTSKPKMSMGGECVYLCSSTLSGHAVLLPCGGLTALARLPLEERVYHENTPDFVKHSEKLEKVYVDCGNAVLRTMNLSWRDHSGNLIPLGETDWTAQLCFGFPTT